MGIGMESCPQDFTQSQGSALVYRYAMFRQWLAALTCPTARASVEARRGVITAKVRISSGGPGGGPGAGRQ